MDRRPDSSKPKCQIWGEIGRDSDAHLDVWPNRITWNHLRLTNHDKSGFLPVKPMEMFRTLVVHYGNVFWGLVNGWKSVLFVKVPLEIVMSFRILSKKVWGKSLEENPWRKSLKKILEKILEEKSNLKHANACQKDPWERSLDLFGSLRKSLDLFGSLKKILRSKK